MDTKLFVHRIAGGMYTVMDRSFTPGKVRWVDSNASLKGDSVGKGKNPQAPYATLDYAIGQCDADNGDVIMVMPKHAETLAADVTVDKANLTIIGLGNGSDKPTLTFGAAAREINITADNCRIEGLRLVSGANDLVNFIDDDAENTEIVNCDFVTGTATEALCFISKATTKDGLLIKGCTALQPTDPEGTQGAAGTGFLYFVDSENITVEDCKIIGNFETAIFHNKTTAGKELNIKDCRLYQALADGEHFVLVDTITGSISRSTCSNPNATDATVAQLVGTIGTTFWLAGDAWFSNDSAAGGQLMVVGDAACS